MDDPGNGQVSQRRRQPKEAASLSSLAARVIVTPSGAPSVGFVVTSNSFRARVHAEDLFELASRFFCAQLAAPRMVISLRGDRKHWAKCQFVRLVVDQNQKDF